MNFIIEMVQFFHNRRGYNILLPVGSPVEIIEDTIRGELSGMSVYGIITPDTEAILEFGSMLS
jgi:hypothetical protein